VVNYRKRQWPKRKNDLGLFHVHESWYNMNIKILVCHITGLASAGSAGPVPIPVSRWASWQLAPIAQDWPTSNWDWDMYQQLQQSFVLQNYRLYVTATVISNAYSVDIRVLISALWFVMLWWSQLEKCRVPHISRRCVFFFVFIICFLTDLMFVIEMLITLLIIMLVNDVYSSSVHKSLQSVN